MAFVGPLCNSRPAAGMGRSGAAAQQAMAGVGRGAVAAMRSCNLAAQSPPGPAVLVGDAARGAALRRVLGRTMRYGVRRAAHIHSSAGLICGVTVKSSVPSLAKFSTIRYFISHLFSFIQRFIFIIIGKDQYSGMVHAKFLFSCTYSYVNILNLRMK